MIHSINLYSFTKFNNQEFAGLMINGQRLISTQTASALGIEAEVNTAFNDRLRELNDQVYSPAASAVTAAMRAADDKRCTIFKRMRLKLQTIEYLEEGSSLLKIVDKVRTELLSKYTGKVPTMPYQEKTAVLQGFLFDLHDKLEDDDVELLGIEGDITRLEQANNAFIEAYQDRVNERAEAETEKTLRLRQELTELFTTICFTTQYLANSVVEGNREKAEASQQFIKLLNVVLAEARTRYLQRRKRQGETGSDEEPSDNPQGGTTDAGNGSANGGGTSTDAGNGSTNGGNTSGSGGNSSANGGNTSDNGGNGSANSGATSGGNGNPNVTDF